LAAGKEQKSWISGIFGSGAARVDLTSFSGTISLRKRF
jgi:hypothetical protein